MDDTPLTFGTIEDNDTTNISKKRLTRILIIVVVLIIIIGIITFIILSSSSSDDKITCTNCIKTIYDCPGNFQHCDFFYSYKIDYTPFISSIIVDGKNVTVLLINNIMKLVKKQY